MPWITPGRIGKRVKIPHGSAAVTGDEHFKCHCWEISRGKAKLVGRPRSQKTCLVHAYQAPNLGLGDCRAKRQDGGTLDELVLLPLKTGNPFPEIQPGPWMPRLHSLAGDECGFFRAHFSCPPFGPDSRFAPHPSSLLVNVRKRYWPCGIGDLPSHDAWKTGNVGGWPWFAAHPRLIGKSSDLI